MVLDEPTVKTGYRLFLTSIRRILAFDQKMRLIWKKFDSAVDPVVAVVGVGFLIAGACGMALLRHAYRHPILLAKVAIPKLLAVMGVLIVVREVQLFRER
jgi:hypothetical protein